MTFVSAWKNKDRLYCIADTAVTGPQVGPDDTLMTSFDETSPPSDSNAVQERLIKIKPISSRSAVAFSGDVDHALEYVRLLRQRASSMSLTSSVREVAGILQLEPDRHLQLVLMDYCDQEGPILAKWDSHDASNVNRVEDHVNIGSLDASQADFSGIHREWGSHFYNMTDLDLFHGMIAMMQRTTMHYPQMEHGVGGAFFGATVGQSGFHWQDNITYVRYALSKSPPPAKISKCSVVDHVGFVAAPPHGLTIFFDSGACPISPAEWMKKHADVDLFDSKYCVWVALLGNNLTVIRMDVRATVNPLFKVKELNKSGNNLNFSIEMSDTFLGFLRNQEPRPGGVLIKFLKLRRE